MAERTNAADQESVKIVFTRTSSWVRILHSPLKPRQTQCAIQLRLEVVILSYTQSNLMDKAYEITKAYATSGGSTPLDTVLRIVFEELKKINSEVSDLD